jgi:PAS domain S-box-containing protein
VIKLSNTTQNKKNPLEFYRFITENANDLIGVIRKTTKYEYINEIACKKYLGYEYDEIIGKRAIDFIHHDDLEKVFKTIADGKKFGEAEVILRFRHKNGNWIWLEVRGKKFIDSNGIPKGLLIARDITEQKILEQKLKESEKKYRFISENANDLIIIINKDGTIEYVNKDPLFKIFGYKPEEVIGRKSSEFIHSDYMGKNGFQTVEYLKKGKTYIELRALHKKNYYKPVEVGISLFIDVNNDVKQLVILRDITERKKTELLLKSSESKYREAYKRVEFYKDLFTHDVINIFQAISSSVDLFKILNKNLKFPKESEDILNIIKSQTNRGNQLVANVRTLSRLDEAEIVIKSTELYRTLENCIKYVKESFFEKEVRIYYNFISHEIYVSANDLLADVFENIFINAIKYNSNEIIEIKIKISRIVEDKRIYIKMEFKDNGIGIQDSRKGLIFQRDALEQKGKKGMGLGLSLVAKTMEKYYGKIWVEDRIPGDYTKGSNFILLIPEAFST